MTKYNFPNVYFPAVREVEAAASWTNVMEAACFEKTFLFRCLGLKQCQENKKCRAFVEAPRSEQSELCMLEANCCLGIFTPYSILNTDRVLSTS